MRERERGGAADLALHELGIDERRERRRHVRPLPHERVEPRRIEPLAEDARRTEYAPRRRVQRFEA